MTKKIKDPNWGGMIATPLYTKVAASIIKEFKLSPAVQPGALTGTRATAEIAKKTLKPGRRTPGIPVPHLHYKDQVYLLNSRQWKAFSTGLMSEFQVKLGKAKTVDFDQLQQISDAVGKLVK